MGGHVRLANLVYLQVTIMKRLMMTVSGREDSTLLVTIYICSVGYSQVHPLIWNIGVRVPKREYRDEVIGIGITTPLYVSNVLCGNIVLIRS